MSNKVPGLGKSKGDVGFNAHLDDGDYLLEAVSCKKEFKSKGGRTAEDETCPFQYVVRTNILAGAEQEDGTASTGRPWTLFMYVDPDHEYTQLMVDRLKNALNAFEVPVRADAFKAEDFPGARATMRIVNEIQEKGKYKGEPRSNASEFFHVKDSVYANSGKKS